MKLRQTGREMQNAMENQAIMRVSQLAQMKGKQPHGHKKIICIAPGVMSFTS